MKYLASIMQVLFLVLMIFMCVLVILAGNGRVQYIFGYKVLQVVSESMQPTIPDKTCIIIKRVERNDIKKGDIITFVSEEAAIRGYFNTHRVYQVLQDAESGESTFLTKGDAYELPDAYPVHYEQIAGKYVRELPFGRWIYKGISFLQDRTHYFIVVILPIFFCCISYLKQLINALTEKEKDTL